MDSPSISHQTPYVRPYSNGPFSSSKKVIPPRSVSVSPVTVYQDDSEEDYSDSIYVKDNSGQAILKEPPSRKVPHVTKGRVSNAQNIIDEIVFSRLDQEFGKAKPVSKTTRRRTSKK